MNNWQSIINGITTGLRIDKRTQIEKESTQGPRLDSDRKSPGTALPFEPPIPTNLTGIVFHTDPLEMNPTNGRHWYPYLAKVADIKRELGTPKHGAKSSPIFVYHALAEPQERVTAGSQDIWLNHYQNSMASNKAYTPMQSLYG